ncbi:uncharacterized protein JCM15063_002324, partial [Sporobolomyces koalae]|uniref:uncharacterized protein n=1 Tax=Sporobolomyces koalae TaxID=500713 RepID=UPI00317BB251
SAAGGFVFATRKSFAPSLAALKRAQALFEEDGDQGIEEDSAFARVSESAALPKLPRSARLSPPPARADSSQTDSIQYPRSDVAPSTFGGFQDARGRSLAMPSEEAIRKARQHFDKSSSPDLSVTSPPRVTLKQQSRASSPEGKDHTSFFSQVAQDPQTFSLRPLIPTSQEDRADVSDSPTVSRTRSFVLSHTDTSEISIRHAARSTSPAQQEQPAVLPVESDDVGSEVGSLTETLVSSSPRQRDASPGIDPSSRPEHTATTIIQPSANPMLKHLIGGTLLPPRAAPFRSPMLNSARTTARTSISTPLRPSTLTTSSTASYAGVATSAATPLFNRRLNLGMTPRNKPFHLANTQSSASGAKGKGKAFITPFKGGKRPDGLTPMGLKSQLGSIVTSSTRKPTLTTVPRAAHAAAARHAEPRLSLVDFDMRPQIHLYEELESIGFSPELLAMNSSNSLTFTFSCGRSVSDAFVELKGLVAARSPGEEGLVARPWVENHWCLIVWKLASYVRSRPDLLAQWWTFDVVMNQLRYRYEREINRAQRSAIKRIQERDSSAAFPMILCVTQLMWDDPAEDAAETECFQIISGLELTDGWYRIQAKIDSTLQSACERGKLIVGSKIAITGARLENLRGDGIDVLEAVNRSKLVLSGNSTSLAPWHAKLGFSPIQFCASLASLSSAGGSVAPLDIIIVRLFELGFVDAARSNTGTWNKEEEALKAEEWERGRKRIHDRMADAAEKDSSEDDGLVALLREAVQSACEGESLARLQEEDDDPEEILEGLETAADPRAVLRNMPLQTIQACLALAVERADQARKQAYQELKNELDRKCPPRQIRSVRMMRVRDAREGINGRCEREAILTVWDVQSYAADFFREGQRYRVTNTIAKGSWQRSHREISLHTKKDSKWIRVEHV